MSTPLPLSDRVALVTGVSRLAGIGAAVAARLLSDGASVLATGWPPHDAEMPWGADAGGDEAIVDELRRSGGALDYVVADLEDAATPDRLVRRTIEHFGRIDIVVANHARSSHQSLADVTVEELDRCWAVNARASALLAKSLAELRPVAPGGRFVLFTSGQHLAPMAGEIAYAISKGAIHQMTSSLSDAVVDLGITVNCINPGPVDTGYATGADPVRIAGLFPAGRWGQPADVARLVAWLACDESEWITGQVVDMEGGFRRWSRGGAERDS